MTTTQLHHVKVSEWDLRRWSDLADTAAGATHAEHHRGPEYPAAWDRCWAEPCRILIDLAHAIEGELEWADDLDDDDEDEEEEEE